MYTDTHKRTRVQSVPEKARASDNLSVFFEKIEADVCSAKIQFLNLSFIYYFCDILSYSKYINCVFNVLFLLKKGFL